jgi:hypothetical protein
MPPPQYSSSPARGNITSAIGQVRKKFNFLFLIYFSVKKNSSIEFVIGWNLALGCGYIHHFPCLLEVFPNQSTVTFLNIVWKQTSLYLGVLVVREPVEHLSPMREMLGLSPVRDKSTHYKDLAVSVRKSQDCGNIQHAPRFEEGKMGTEHYLVSSKDVTCMGDIT